MARSTAIPTFAALGAQLAAMGARSAPVIAPFKVTNERAAIRLSEPMQIVAVHYNEASREIRVVGEDANVRVCKIDRLTSINAARELWKALIEAKNSTREVQFKAAGGFSPDRWFFDIEG